MVGQKESSLIKGQCFEGKLFKALCKEARVRKMRTTPYHPMGNRQAERFNRTLLTMLGTLPSDQKLNWQSWVNDLVQSYNCSVSGVTGFSPYFLMFGRKPRLPVDDEFEVTFPLVQSCSTHQYVEKFKERLHWAFQTAKEHIAKDLKHVINCTMIERYIAWKLSQGSWFWLDKKSSGQLTKLRTAGRFQSIKS